MGLLSILLVLFLHINAFLVLPDIVVGVDSLPALVLPDIGLDADSLPVTVLPDIGVGVDVDVVQ